MTFCIDCASSDVDGPDDEGFFDCFGCGAAWLPPRPRHRRHLTGRPRPDFGDWPSIASFLYRVRAGQHKA